MGRTGEFHSAQGVTTNSKGAIPHEGINFPYVDEFTRDLHPGIKDIYKEAREIRLKELISAGADENVKIPDFKKCAETPSVLRFIEKFGKTPDHRINIQINADGSFTTIWTCPNCLVLTKLNGEMVHTNLGEVGTKLPVDGNHYDWGELLGLSRAEDENSMQILQKWDSHGKLEGTFIEQYDPETHEVHYTQILAPNLQQELGDHGDVEVHGDWVVSHEAQSTSIQELLETGDFQYQTLFADDNHDIATNIQSSEYNNVNYNSKAENVEGNGHDNPNNHESRGDDTQINHDRGVDESHNENGNENGHENPNHQENIADDTQNNHEAVVDESHNENGNGNGDDVPNHHDNGVDEIQPNFDSHNDVSADDMDFDDLLDSILGNDGSSEDDGQQWFKYILNQVHDTAHSQSVPHHDMGDVVPGHHNHDINHHGEGQNSEQPIGSGLSYGSLIGKHGDSFSSGNHETDNQDNHENLKHQNDPKNNIQNNEESGIQGQNIRHDNDHRKGGLLSNLVDYLTSNVHEPANHHQSNHRHDYHLSQYFDHNHDYPDEVHDLFNFFHQH